jgi:hypothetical protein
VIAVYAVVMLPLGAWKAGELAARLYSYLEACWQARSYRRRMYLATRHTLPRATVKKLRAARIALHEKLLDRRSS